MKDRGGFFNKEPEYAMFKYVKKDVKKADLAIGNLESSLAGPGRGYSGYPQFNAPEHLAIDLKEMGVDIMTTANNHTLDCGFSGLSSTLDYLDDTLLKIYEDFEEKFIKPNI